MVANKSRAATGAKSNRNDASMWKKAKLASCKLRAHRAPTEFDMQKLEQTFYRLIEQLSFLHQTGQSLSTLPAADANGETPPLHLQNRAGCWGIQADCGVVSHNIWTNVTAWLSSLTPPIFSCCHAPHIQTLKHAHSYPMVSISFPASWTLQIWSPSNPLPLLISLLLIPQPGLPNQRSRLQTGVWLGRQCCASPWQYEWNLSSVLS